MSIFRNAAKSHKNYKLSGQCILLEKLDITRILLLFFFLSLLFSLIRWKILHRRGR
jgi:hypothetical protein